jgi:spermidine synthase
MGMSLPLLAKSLTRSVEGAAGIIGALYGFNTLGAAVGAFVTTWVCIRAFGFAGTVQIGAALNIFSALGALLVAPYFLHMRASQSADADAAPAAQTGAAPADRPLFALPVWIAVYSLSGFVALALEVVWFRALSVMLKSTAFTFGTLLAIYLTGLALGTFWGIRKATSSRDAARLFLAVQAGVTLYAATSLAVFTYGLGPQGLLAPLWIYFAGYEPVTAESLLSLISNPGAPLVPPNTSGKALVFVVIDFLLPLFFIGPPTLMMGLSFPLLQRVVQSNVAFLGRRVGWLQTANIFGSMLGSILTGWVLLRFLGTATTLKILVACGGVFVFLYLAIRFRGAVRRRIMSTGLMALSLALVIWWVPDSGLLWAKLHGTTPEYAISGEDGSGLSLLKSAAPHMQGPTMLYVNGIGQSEIPYGGAHTLLGLLPAMIHPAPRQIAVIGLGSGDTPVAAGLRAETEQVTVIEIIASQLATLRQYYAAQPDRGVASLLNDPRMKIVFGDGRAYLRLNETKYDIIEADALRPTSAYSGNLYSEEYFTLLKTHLNRGGFAVTWEPTARIRDTFAKVFPYVLPFHVSGEALIGSNEPIAWDAPSLRQRLNSPSVQAYAQRIGIDAGQYIEQFIDYHPTVLVRDAQPPAFIDTNTDLFPRDEYLVPR